MATPTFTISPANATQGIALETKIVITFDQLMDHDTITITDVVMRKSTSGTTWSGPDLVLWQDYTSELEDIITGTISLNDYSGVTVATFSPSNILNETTSYKVILSKDIANLSGEILGKNYSIGFTTGSGSVIAEPTTSSLPLIGVTPVALTGELNVVSTSPANRTTNLSLSTNTITVVFDKVLDETTITNDTVTLIAESVNEDASITATGDLQKTLDVNGNTLTISILVSGQVLYENNIIIVTLSSSIQAADSTSLEEDYDFYFTTTYNPLYTTVRRIRLNIGTFISNIPDDTINLMIFENSLMANQLVYNASSSGDLLAYAKMVWTSCRTQADLIIIAKGDKGGNKSKRLADLQVSYGDDDGLDEVLNRSIQCMNKWLPVLQSGGKLGVGEESKPKTFSKGVTHVDYPVIAREWMSTNDPNVNHYPAANIYARSIYSDGSKSKYKKDYLRKWW